MRGVEFQLLSKSVELLGKLVCLQYSTDGAVTDCWATGMWWMMKQRFIWMNQSLISVSYQQESHNSRSEMTLLQLT